MIRITLQRTGHDVVMTLEGVLSAATVPQVADAWLDARRGLRHHIRVDLRGVCRVDDRGRELLSRLYADGAEFVTAGCEMPEIVREIADHHALVERI